MKAILQQITDRLVAATGVDPRAMDAARLAWTVDTRVRRLGLANAAVYAARLEASAEDLEALIDATVIHETRFFRDPAVFEHLRRWLPQAAAHFPGTLRVLSAPCSTGQEAYSLAATLEQAGTTRYSIDAFDISPGALAIARAAAYPVDALRGMTLMQQQLIGSAKGEQWTIHNGLREPIRFERRNLAEAGALRGGEPYHLILCRNLFIYLRPEARAALAQSLSAALAPGGRLVLGSADRVEELNVFFAPLKPAASFAFTHRQAAAEAAVVVRPRRAVAQRLLKPIPVPPNRSEPAPTTAFGLYQRALEHHQVGDLCKAERRCRQALYLDPRYLPALELLETLWHRHPNLRLRRALEARIRRHRTEQLQEAR